MFARAPIRTTRRLSATRVASMLLAFACSAPPGTGDDDSSDIPEFRGTLGGPATGTPANGAPGAASNGMTPTSGAPAPGAGGSSGSEPVGAGVPLTPSPANGASQGAGGAAMVAPAPGNDVGAGGSSMTPAGAGGGGMTPNEGNPNPQTPPNNPPPNNPPPVTPPPVTPPPVAPPPSGDCGGQFFCDGFESVGDGASPTSALWTIIDGYAEREQSANVQVSADNARSGGQALRVTNTNSRTGVVATLPQQRYFIRAYLMADAVPLGPVFIGLGTDQNSETRLRIQGQSFATINTFAPGQGDAVRPGAANSGNCPDCVRLTPNQWFCAEFFIDEATRNAVLWIDGVEAASVVNGEGGWPPQPENPRVFLGSMSVQGGSTGVWIDDVAAGPERIGCD